METIFYMNIRSIILASHGTPGARAAEHTAIGLAADNKASLFHLLVVPDFWKGMMGDDWLNNAVTQIRYGDYVENQLVEEAVVEVERIGEAAKSAGVACQTVVRLGKPTDCLAKMCAAGDFDLAVIGAPRPKGMEGYRSRMVLDPLLRSVHVNLLIIPHPGA